jgi:hypothetical protein
MLTLLLEHIQEVREETTKNLSVCLMEYLTSTKAQLLVSIVNEPVERVVMLQFMAPLLGVCKRQASGHGNEPKISA